MDQNYLREQLKSVRENLSYHLGLVSSLKDKEMELLKQIKPKEERCQACMGTGKVKEYDVWSGWEGDMKCCNCDGTGRWREPV